MKSFFPHIVFPLLVPCLLYADKSDPQPKMVSAGNLSLPASQQPAPLVSFGENIVDKNQAQFFLLADAFIGKNNYATDVVPSLLYGIRDDLSIFLSVPFSPGNRDQEDHSSGIEDILAQLEYAFYSHTNPSSENQATIVANIMFPTGSSSKDPPTGFGATSFFVGATFNHTTVDWFVFTSPGSLLTTTTEHGTKFGDELWYQFGIGRNIPSPKGWIFACLIEFDGIYAWKDKIKGHINPDSGGNVIYMTPSLWFSSKKIILQFGAGYPIVQHLFGHQSKKYLSLDFNFGYTF